MTAEEYLGDWLKVIDRNELNRLIPIIYGLYSKRLCMPEYTNIFKVFNITPYDNTKIIMLFQDPYPQKNVATGIALGNKKDTEILSPSLEVIKESVINFEVPHNYRTFDPSLEDWCRQGVLMLNSSLTVEVGKPGSHSVYWRKFISTMLQNLAEVNPGLIYVLWGSAAKSFINFINPKDTVIQMNHPAWYARTNTKIPSSFFTDLNKLVKYNFNETINWYTDYGED